MKIIATLNLALGLLSLQGCFDSSDTQTRQNNADGSKASVQMQKPEVGQK
jgi:hypothetical protein